MWVANHKIIVESSQMFLCVEKYDIIEDCRFPQWIQFLWECKRFSIWYFLQLLKIILCIQCQKLKAAGRVLSWSWSWNSSTSSNGWVVSKYPICFLFNKGACQLLHVIRLTMRLWKNVYRAFYFSFLSFVEKNHVHWIMVKIVRFLPITPNFLDKILNYL